MKRSPSQGMDAKLVAFNARRQGWNAKQASSLGVTHFLAEETSLVLTTVVTPVPKSMPFSWMLFLFSELFFS